MSINYNIKADQILGILGYNQPAGEGFLNGFERENNVKLPLCLRNFYKVAYKCPLLSTADIWTDDMLFYYKQIKEEIEDFKKITGMTQKQMMRILREPVSGSFFMKSLKNNGQNMLLIIWK